MKTLTLNIGWVCLASILAGLACGLISFGVSGWSGFKAVLTATVICGLVGIAVVIFLFRYEVSAGVIVAATLLRLILTIGVTTLVVLEVPELISLEFFLTLTVIYLVNLSVETWIALNAQQTGSGKFV